MSILDYIDSDILSPSYSGDLPYLQSPNIDSICRELYYAIRMNEKIFIYGDSDMDGFCASLVWQEVLSGLYDIKPDNFSYIHRIHTVDKDILEQSLKSDARIVLILDSGSSEVDHEITAMLRLRGKTPIIIDHHNWQGNYKEHTKNFLVFNSYEESSLIGGHQVSGAYASLLVAYVLCKKYFKRSLSYNAMVYALASMYSDVVDLSTPVGRALYNRVVTIKMPNPLFISCINDVNYSVSRRLFSYIVGPKVNACFRTEDFSPLNRVFSTTDKYSMQVVANDFKKTHSYAANLVNIFKDMFIKERIGGILLCTHRITEKTKLLHIRNFSGLIANAISKEEKCMVVVAVQDDNSRYEGSYRDFYNRKMLDVFKLFCDADGHDSAFGLSFYNYNEFKRYLSGLSKTLTQSNNFNYNILSSELIDTKEDIQVLALYNEYMNVRPMTLLSHRCEYVKNILNSSFKKIYDVGLPYNVISVSPLIAGSNIIIEPTITKNVELRCVE